PDLQANIWTNTAEIAGNGIDDDGNGYIDDVHGWDFVDNDNDPSADAGNGEGHGTMVAGCIGAVGNNGIGVAGVNWNVSIMPLKFSGDVASELAALNYAAANGAQIVNASWGGPQFSFAESAGMQTLLDNGILLVAAAGNYDGNNDRVLDYPSSLPHANILAVSAYKNDGNLTSWSHFGATTVDVAAPGSGIYTTTTPNTYDFVSGTSFSAPYTAGIAALILAQYPTLSYQEVKGRIMASVDTMNQKMLNATDGRVNAAKALTMPAQPELVIADLQLSDNNNNQLDPNESINLNIELENVWLAATGITASLSSSHALVSVFPASVSWANLNMGAKAFANSAFTLNIGDISGFSHIPFTLTIQTNNGVSFTRHFNLDIGTLIADTIHQGQIMRHDQDEFQYYHIDVPAGSAFLNITSAAQNDIDILLRFAAPSQFDYALYSINPKFGRDPNTIVSVAAHTGNEQILISQPQAGTWFVTVISYDQKPTNYQILASTTSSQALVPSSSSSSSKSSLCLSPTWLTAWSNFTLLLLLLYFMRQQRSTITRKST
ncbi:MAG: S8 family peptidase, partial [Mariprofundaceae bacterium]|nr:S8 family peptidase [Mariprofundaceae bacterium]